MGLTAVNQCTGLSARVLADSDCSCGVANRKPNQSSRVLAFWDDCQFGRTFGLGRAWCRQCRYTVGDRSSAERTASHREGNRSSARATFNRVRCRLGSSSKTPSGSRGLMRAERIGLIHRLRWLCNSGGGRWSRLRNAAHAPTESSPEDALGERPEFSHPRSDKRVNANGDSCFRF